MQAAEGAAILVDVFYDAPKALNFSFDQLRRFVRLRRELAGCMIDHHPSIHFPGRLCPDPCAELSSRMMKAVMSGTQN